MKWVSRNKNRLLAELSLEVNALAVVRIFEAFFGKAIREGTKIASNARSRSRFLNALQTEWAFCYYEAAEKVFPPSLDLSMRLAASHFNAGNLAEAERRFKIILRTTDGRARSYALQSLQTIFRHRQRENAGGSQ